MLNLFKNATFTVYKEIGVFSSDGSSAFKEIYSVIPTVFSSKKLYRDKSTQEMYLTAQAVIDNIYPLVDVKCILLCSLDNLYYEILSLDPNSSAEKIEFLSLSLQQKEVSGLTLEDIIYLIDSFGNFITDNSGNRIKLN